MGCAAVSVDAAHDEAACVRACVQACGVECGGGAVLSAVDEPKQQPTRAKQ
jgi:hypothetical protein